MADKRNLVLTITRVDQPVFSGEVEYVTVPGIDGEMTLLAEHAALISPLKEGTIRYKAVGEETSEVVISMGTLEVSNNHATVLI